MSDETKPGLDAIEGSLFGIKATGGSVWSAKPSAPPTLADFERLIRPRAWEPPPPILVSPDEFQWFVEQGVIDADGRSR